MTLQNISRNMRLERIASRMSKDESLKREVQTATEEFRQKKIVHVSQLSRRIPSIESAKHVEPRVALTTCE